MERTWDLLILLTLRELRLRYQDTILGFVWSLIKPLLLGAVLFVALKTFVRIETENPYHLVLLTALFPWIWFQTSILLAAPSFASNGALIKKIHFPRFVLPLSTVANNGIHFLVSLPILIFLILISGYRPSPSWLLGIPVLTLIQLGMLTGVVLLVASLDVFFRDLEHLVEVFLSLWFYVTPIIYPLDIVPEPWDTVLLINPLASLIEGWRSLFLENALPGLELWPALLFTVAALAVGAGVFRRLEGGFADAL